MSFYRHSAQQPHPHDVDPQIPSSCDVTDFLQAGVEADKLALHGLRCDIPSFEPKVPPSPAKKLASPLGLALGFGSGTLGFGAAAMGGSFRLGKANKPLGASKVSPLGIDPAAAPSVLVAPLQSKPALKPPSPISRLFSRSEGNNPGQVGNSPGL